MNYSEGKLYIITVVLFSVGMIFIGLVIADNAPKYYILALLGLLNLLFLIPICKKIKLENNKILERELRKQKEEERFNNWYTEIKSKHNIPFNTIPISLNIWNYTNNGINGLSLLGISNYFIAKNNFDNYRYWKYLIWSDDNYIYFFPNSDKEIYNAYNFKKTITETDLTDIYKISKISFDNIELYYKIDETEIKSYEIIHENKSTGSPIGRAVIGGVIAGPAGAIVGAISGAAASNKQVTPTVEKKFSYTKNKYTTLKINDLFVYIRDDDNFASYNMLLKRIPQKVNIK